MRNVKILSVLLALMLVFGLFAGCSTDDSPTPSAPAVTEAPDVSASAAPAEEPGVVFPLEQRAEFSMWNELYEKVQGAYQTENDNPAIKEMEKRTNVHINFVHPPRGSEAETFSLMLASMDYEDVMETQFSTYSMTQLLEQEVITDLTDLIPEFMPNFNRVIHSNEDLLKDVKNDKGRILGMYRIIEEVGMNWAGLVVRQDLLDKVGLPVPETYSDWEAMGLAFKEYGIKKPINIPANGSFEWYSNLENGFGIGARFYRDGTTAKYGPIEPGYKEYVTLMHDWYEKGIINQEFTAQTGFEAYGFSTGPAFYSGDMGATMLSSSEIASQIVDNGLTAVSDMYVTAVYTPVKNKGDKVNYSIIGGSGVVRMPFGISTQVSEEMRPIIMSYFDYLFSDEGRLLGSYGVEGYSWEYDENGKPQYTDVVNTAAFDNVKTFHVYGVALFAYPFLENDKEKSLGRAPEIVEMQSRWIVTGTDLSNLPTLSLTAEESARNSAIVNDVNTYVAEMTAKFITGQESMDKYDDFVAQVKSMGIEEAVAITQTALDRYNSR
jgi:putative aldouronate transport system substrate-binding protein